MSITNEEYRVALIEADRRMKMSNGHEYMTILKTRCIHCGRSRKVKTKCGGWFATFVSCLGRVLLEKGVIVDKPA